MTNEQPLNQRQKLKQNFDDQDLVNVFTDAVEVRKAFDDLIFSDEILNSNIHLLVICGAESVGKTTALRMCRLLCRDRGIPVALIESTNITREACPTLQTQLLKAWEDCLVNEGINLCTFPNTLKRYKSLDFKIRKLLKEDPQIAPIFEELEEHKESTRDSDLVEILLAGTDFNAKQFRGWIQTKFSPDDANLYLDPNQTLTQAFLEDLKTAVTSGNRIVLMIDTYDQIMPLNNWMCNFTSQLPNNVFLVIATCRKLDWGTYWIGFEQKTFAIKMEEMKIEDLRELINKAYKTNPKYIFGQVGDPDPKQVEEIAVFARGIPVVARTIVKLWIERNVKDWEITKLEVVSDLVQNYLMKNLSDTEKKAFKAAAVLRHFKIDSLNALIPGCNANQLFEELQKWPFVVIDEKWRILEGMRQVILEYIRSTSPDFFQQLQKSALAYYQLQLANKSLNKQEIDRVNLEILYHKISLDEKHGIKKFQDIAEELATSLLSEKLRVFLADANSYNLESTNSKLWKKFYDARLKELDRDFQNAKTIYREIIETKTEEVEAKLRAYALFDLGRQYSNRENNSSEREKAISLLTKSLKALDEPDGRVIFAYRNLWLLYTWNGKPDEGIKQLEKLLSFHEKHGNTSGIVATLGLFKGAYAMKGDWKKADLVIRRGDDLLRILKDAIKPSLFNILFHSFEDCPWIYTWSGRYHKAEEKNETELKFLNNIEAIHEYLLFLKDRALIFGLQGRYADSLSDFTKALKKRRQEKDRNEAEIAGLLGYWGLVSIRKGDLDKAEECLKESLRIKEKLKDEVGIPEVKNWLGELYETKSHSLEGEEKVATLKFAEAYYEQSLGLRRLDRCYFECGALIGLARVSYWLGDYSTMQSYLTEAEALIHQYEYNDYAAVSRLMQGHLMWLSDAMQNSMDETRFNQILISYKESLIYALRYNRYLLDEILSGRSPRAIPLIKPIISTCQERDEEGQRMLVALHLWWQEASNALSTSQSETVFPIPIGISLQEAERMARDEEEGDGSPQKSVIEQIDEMLLNY